MSSGAGLVPAPGHRLRRVGERFLARHVLVGEPGRSSAALVPVALSVVTIGAGVVALAVVATLSAGNAPFALAEPLGGTTVSFGGASLVMLLLVAGALFGSVPGQFRQMRVCTTMGVRIAVALSVPYPVFVLACVAEVALLAARSRERSGLKAAYNLVASLLGGIAALTVLAALTAPGGRSGPLDLLAAAVVMVGMHTALVWLVLRLDLGVCARDCFAAAAVPALLVVEVATAPLLVLAAAYSPLAPAVALVFLGGVAWLLHTTRVLTRDATVDELTAVANRRSWTRRTELALRRRRGQRPLAVVLFDLDGFKAVNDEHGHPVGDAVLAEVARRIVAAARPGDVVGRLGGDEFAVTLPDADHGSANDVVRRVDAALDDPLDLARGPAATRVRVRLGICSGVAVAPQDGADVATLYAAADHRLVLEKATRSGRSTREGRTPTSGSGQRPH